MIFTVSTIPYTIDGPPHEGRWMHDSSGEPKPAVLMATDQLGIGEGAIAMATDFAVFIADTYGTSKRVVNCRTAFAPNPRAAPSPPV